MPLLPEVNFSSVPILHCDPYMQNKMGIRINMFWLCENAWFSWQYVMYFSRMGVDLQN